MSLVVYTPGCWDLFHVGHLRFLEAAAKLGERLVVGVASDKVITEDKGRPPIINQIERLEIIKGLRCVSKAVIYFELSFVKEITTFQPDILAVGEFWGEAARHKVAELCMVQKKVVKLPYCKQTSTTRIIEHIRESLDFNPENKEW